MTGRARRVRRQASFKTRGSYPSREPAADVNARKTESIAIGREVERVFRNGHEIGPRVEQMRRLAPSSGLLQLSPQELVAVKTQLRGYDRLVKTRSQQLHALLLECDIFFPESSIP